MSNPLIKKISLDKDNKPANLTSIALKEIFLLLLVAISALVTIATGYATAITTLVTGIMSLILVVFVSFKPQFSKIIAPLYAILEGMFLAYGSLMLEALYPGMVITAVIMTICIALVTAGIYAYRPFEVNDKFRTIIAILLLSLLGCYAIKYIAMYFFNISLAIFGSGLFGIAIDVLIIGLAIACLFIDYDDINELINKGANKEQEWYYAISLLITLLWLYMRILELLENIK